MSISLWGDLIILEWIFRKKNLSLKFSVNILSLKNFQITLFFLMIILSSSPFTQSLVTPLFHQLFPFIKPT